MRSENGSIHREGQNLRNNPGLRSIQHITFALVLLAGIACNAVSSQTLQRFSFESVSCRVEAPEGFSLGEKNTQVGKMFVLSDPNTDRKDASSLSISIVPTGNPKEVELLEGVLDPYRRGLRNYKEEKKRAAKINGVKYANRRFSGSFPNGSPTTGFVYVAAHDGVYFIIIGEGNGPAGPQNLDTLLKSVKTFQASVKDPKNL